MLSVYPTTGIVCILIRQLRKLPLPPAYLLSLQAIPFPMRVSSLKTQGGKLWEDLRDNSLVEKGVRYERSSTLMSIRGMVHLLFAHNFLLVLDSEPLLFWQKAPSMLVR